MNEYARRVIACSGKVYSDLYEEREKRGIVDIYLLRIEQLYPFPTKLVVVEVGRFKKAGVVRCQEEPWSMGARTFVDPYLEWALSEIGARTARVRYIGRSIAASPTVGVMPLHMARLVAFLEEACAA